MSFSPFPIPTRSEHERDLASGRSQVPYGDLVALLEETALAEEELLSAAAGGYSYVQPLEEGHAEHPDLGQIKPTTLRHLSQAMHAAWRCLFHQKIRRTRYLQNWELSATAVRVAVTIAAHHLVHRRDHQASRSVAQKRSHSV